MGNKKYNVGTVHLSEIQSFFLALFSFFKISHPVFYSSESGETFMISRVVTAVSNISSIFSERCVSDFSMHSRSGLVTGCFATKVVQQSSYGKIEVSNVLIFSAISMISCLSKAMTGRNTGIVQTAFVATRLCIVWLATWPTLSPVINDRHPVSFPIYSAIFII